MIPHTAYLLFLIDVLSSYCDVHDYGDVLFSQPSPEKSADSGIIAERSLVSMIYAVRTAVNNVLAEERFPLVIGGDCPILLGCLAAIRDIHNSIAMLFVDGHEDWNMMCQPNRTIPVILVQAIARVILNPCKAKSTFLLAVALHLHNLKSSAERQTTISLMGMSDT